jgi:hypothetical protein
MSSTAETDSNSKPNTPQPVKETEDIPEFKKYSGPKPKPGGLITNVTLALNSDPETFEPIDPTDEFGPAATIHAVLEVKNAPQGTNFAAKWFTTDVGEADEPDLLIDETDSTAGGSGFLDFSLTPDIQFPVGNYRVEIYIDNKLDKVAEFSIVENGPQIAESARYSGTEIKIESITMAKGVKGPEKQPVNLSTIFKPAEIIHAVVKVKDAPSETNITAIWVATDVGSAADPDTEIITTTVQISGSGNIDFTLEPNKPLPVGDYRVEIQVEGETIQVQEFQVKK